jgi:branched-chain amino acid transport system ATP-binding protein
VHEPVYRRAVLGLGRSYQITSVFPEFSVLANVTLAVQAHAGHSFSFWRPLVADRDLADRAREALTEVGLAPKADVIVRSLAHGERRQLEVAMTLASRPKLLLLDEPMAGMSLAESERMVALLRRSRAATASCSSSTTWTPCGSSRIASRCSCTGA